MYNFFWVIPQPVTAFYIIGHIHLENLLVHVSGVPSHAILRGYHLHILLVERTKEISSVHVLFPELSGNFTPHMYEPIRARISGVED